MKKVNKNLKEGVYKNQKEKDKKWNIIINIKLIYQALY
jgi:hypothetical protein